MNCELTGTPENKLDAPEGDRDIATAQEIADDILLNGFRNYDIFDWKSFDVAAKDKFIEAVIRGFSTYERDTNLPYHENQAERLNFIEILVGTEINFCAAEELLYGRIS